MSVWYLSKSPDPKNPPHMSGGRSAPRDRFPRFVPHAGRLDYERNERVLPEMPEAVRRVRQDVLEKVRGAAATLGRAEPLTS